MINKLLFKTFDIKIKFRGIYIFAFIVFLLCSIFVYNLIQYDNANYIVPKLVGMTLSEAKTTLDSKGIKYNIKEINSEFESGTVIGQSPAYNEKISINEKIEIDVSRYNK